MKYPKASLQLPRPLLFCKENEEKILTILNKLNGRASSHTFNLTQIAGIISEGEQSLKGLSFSKKDSIGAKVVGYSGAALPSCYKFPVLVNQIVMTKKARGWYVECLVKEQVWPKNRASVLVLSKAQDEKACKNLRNKYLIQK